MQPAQYSPPSLSSRSGDRFCNAPGNASIVASASRTSPPQNLRRRPTQIPSTPLARRRAHCALSSDAENSMYGQEVEVAFWAPLASMRVLSPACPRSPCRWGRRSSAAAQRERPQARRPSLTRIQRKSRTRLTRQVTSGIRIAVLDG
jgi:hypothetical protein